MRMRAVLLVAALLALIAGPFGAAWAKPAGSGAFLTDYADTVQQLVGQVESGRLIALRYAKHFRTDPSTVLTYFRNELSVRKLDRSGTYTMYFLDASRNIASRSLELKAGTTVFANKAGVPILQYGTGNPLAATLILGARDLPDTLNTPQTQPSAAQGQNVSVQVLDQPPTELPGTTTNPVTVPTTTTPGVTSTQTTGTVVAANPGLPAPTPTGAGGTVASGGGSTNWLPLLGLAGAAAALAGGGGGGNSPNVIPSDGGDGGSGAVPEPASMLILMSGIAGVGAGYLRRGFRKQR